MKRSVIAQTLREKSGLSLCKFANDLGVSRQTIYDSLEGKGSRRIRIEIAKQVQVMPSMLWSGNKEEIKIVDDFAYIRSL